MWSRTWRAWSRSFASRVLVVRARRATRGTPGRRTSRRRRPSCRPAADDEVRAQPSVLGRDVRLRLEVAVLDHPRHLDDAAQLDLAPAAAHVRPVAERADEVAGLAPQLLLRLRQLTHLLGQHEYARVRATSSSCSFPSTFCSDSLIGRRGARPPASAARGPASSAAEGGPAGPSRARGTTCCSWRGRRPPAPSSSSRRSPEPRRAVRGVRRSARGRQTRQLPRQGRARAGVRSRP